MRRWLCNNRNALLPTSHQLKINRSSSIRTKPQATTDGLLRRALSPFVAHSPNELAQHLAQNVVFHSVGDVLVVDKPYGIGSLGYVQKQFGVFRTTRFEYQQERADVFDYRKKDDSVTLEDAIPHLRRIFEEPNLHFCIGLKRWVSGPVVFPCSKKSFKRITHSIFQGESISHSREGESARHMHRALAICISMPPKDKDTVFGYATFQNTGHANEYMFVPSAKIGKRARYGKFAVQGELSYEVLGSKYGLSLIDLHFSKFSRHFPRLILSHLGSPIFGDWLYEKRLLDVDGKPTVTGPKDAWRGKKYEPMEFLNKIGIKAQQDLKPAPPLFLSVYQTTLPFYGDTEMQRRTTDFVSKVLPPEHFLALANMLEFTPVIEKLLN